MACWNWIRVVASAKTGRRTSKRQTSGLAGKIEIVERDSMIGGVSCAMIMAARGAPGSADQA